MTISRRRLLPALLLSLTLSLPLRATLLYVDLNSPGAVPPYVDWNSAATNIQDAIDAAAAGDTVLVTNGVYAVGGKVMAGNLTNRIALDKPLTVMSVNGPLLTTVAGAGATNGNGAVRCAWLTNGAVLQGFTLTAGATRTSGDITNLQSGGGVLCLSSNALIRNCLVISNVANSYGGGQYQGSLMNCGLIGNRTTPGGSAAAFASLLNCTVVSNLSSAPLHYGKLTNCIVYYNFATASIQTIYSYCCTYPLPAGTGNISNAPLLLGDAFHLTSASPCRGVGTNLADGADIDGQPWTNPPAMGCDEWQPAPVIIRHPVIQYAGDPFGFSVNVAAVGQEPFVCSWAKDGAAVVDDVHFNASQTTNLLVTRLGELGAGNYQVVVSNAFGAVTSSVARLAVHYVDAANVIPVVPYLSWATAATNIQDAINAAAPGDLVLVTNGIYASGGKVMAGDLTNRIALDKAIRVQSANGPWQTSILGAGATNGTAAVRVAWLAAGASLMGFTLRGGAVRTDGSTTDLRSGGGAWCASSNAFVWNCVIVSNTASSFGGGLYQGNLNNSLLQGNSVSPIIGGISYNATLNNCTVISNTGWGAVSASPAFAWLTNCIIYDNAGGNYSGGTYAYCCTTPLPSGAGNFTNRPKYFFDTLLPDATSPCRSAGTNLTAGTDLYGRAWADPPSVGCAQWQPAPMIGVQPRVQVSGVPPGFSLNVAVGGQEPFGLWWLKDGNLIEDDVHHGTTHTTNLVVAGIGLPDAGGYQVILSNAFGMVTSQVVQVSIHCADAAGTNPTPPFTSWTTAATNLQDAINAAPAGGIVLATNGTYASGGKVMFGNLTNRVALDKPMLVLGVSGFAHTVIEGSAGGSVATGLTATRCAWLTNGAALVGFTLRNGATRSSGNSEEISGGGFWGTSSNAVVANCWLTNNAAWQGGGAAFGMVRNSVLVANTADEGGGAYQANLNNCTVVNNFCTTSPTSGGGTYQGKTRNCIVTGNYYLLFGFPNSIANYTTGSDYSYCCTTPSISGAGNLNASPEFLDTAYHLPAVSLCRGAGSAAYAAGVDNDGESWASPPSIGADEVVDANLSGPLSLEIIVNTSPALRLPRRNQVLTAVVTGRAARMDWHFGDGGATTNAGYLVRHTWTNAGDYTLTATAYNNDFPAGVSTNLVVHILPINQPTLGSAIVSNNAFRFTFDGQSAAKYTIQYATNLAPPVLWQNLYVIFSSPGGPTQFGDAAWTNSARFYRVLAE